MRWTLCPVVLAACATGGVVREVAAPVGPDCSPHVEGGDAPEASLTPRYLGVEAGDDALPRGGSATVVLGLENLGEDDMDYPQLEVYVDALTPADQGTIWYGIFAGQTHELPVAVEVPADFADDRVVFEASVSRLVCEAGCPPENTLWVTLCVVP